MKTILTLFALTLALSGCSLLPDKITGGPGMSSTLSAIAGSPTIVTDLQSAAFNLDSAVTIGVLEKNDPAPACLHAILIKAGIETVPGAEPAASFVPKKDGVASAGAIAYILVQQAKKAARTATPVDPNCEALVGRIVIDGAVAIRRATPSVLGILR